VGQSVEPILIPSRYPTASIFVDESGSRATASTAFVVAAVKTRRPGLLARAVRDLRDRTSFDGELKFSEITRGAIPVYCEVIRILYESEATIAATVVQGNVYNPFHRSKETWKVHAEVTAQLLVGCINRRELVGVHLDAISTPRGCSFEDTVRRMVNGRLSGISVVSAVCLDSRTNDLLQVADIVAGCILHERRLASGSPPKTVSNKGKVARYLSSMFGRPGLTDGRDGRLNILTYRGRRHPHVGIKVTPLPVPPPAG
jgi:hypothetical protein